MKNTAIFIFLGLIILLVLAPFFVNRFIGSEDATNSAETDNEALADADTEDNTEDAAVLDIFDEVEDRFEKPSVTPTEADELSPTTTPADDDDDSENDNEPKPSPTISDVRPTIDTMEDSGDVSINENYSTGKVFVEDITVNSFTDEQLAVSVSGKQLDTCTTGGYSWEIKAGNVITIDLGAKTDDLIDAECEPKDTDYSTDIEVNFGFNPENTYSLDVNGATLELPELEVSE